MRVFISSTCFDLIDIRAEFAEQLRILGITPVLSDDKLSDFRVQHDVNSIETCLINVDSCDELVLILDKRYGPTLEKFGYGEFSATHLEYLRAVEKKIPVRVYVRDRLEADFVIWKRNHRSGEVTFSWIDKKDIGLFTLLDGHAPLEANATTSNWYSTFTSSIDLKAAVTKHFEKRILPERLVQAIQNNNFPLFDIKVSISKLNINQFKVEANLTNVSHVPAFKFNIYWENNVCESQKDIIFPSGQTISMTCLWNISTPMAMNYKNPPPPFERFLIVEYESPIEISVRDRFRVHGRLNDSAIVRGGSLVDRKFRRSSGISIEIEDDF
jgi:hypothetical protein